ncbi:MAG: NAD(+) synthase [Deltaproteobacteria bacterium]|nr:NAD(+) synthase [Deltaproteobacteria bacterium]
MDFTEHGFYRIGTVSPRLELARPHANAEKIIELVNQRELKQCTVVVFPELCITGYSCEDLFHASGLLDESLAALDEIRKETKNISSVIIVGAPYRSPDSRLWNSAFVISGGKINGVIPKSFLPRSGEYYEFRWFSPGDGVEQCIEDPMLGSFLLSPYQIFRIGKLQFAVEVCEDLWAPIPPSCHHALMGAQLIVNLSASNELIGKASYRKELVRNQSARLICAYAYTSAGPLESSKDVVFGGHTLIAENGVVLAEGKRFSLDDQLTLTEIDINKIAHDRSLNKTFADCRPFARAYVYHDIGSSEALTSLQRPFSPTPFYPADPQEFSERALEMVSIQSTGLARRLLSTPCEGLVVGLSGGLDSTLAVLVAVQAMELLNRPAQKVLTVSLPGPGTTSHTKTSAQMLASELGTSFLEISIEKAVKQHFEDIGHDPKLHDVVFENSQARERTQILFDLANKHNALLVGTGDLSELALGWCTYNGDHMSSYHVNASVPKTLVQHIIQWIAHHKVKPSTRDVLLRILATPISPELLPPDENGKMTQETEKILGHYELHDFFLFHYLRNGFSPQKLEALAGLAFERKHSLRVIRNTLHTFLKRFHENQFKRTCLPAGPKVGSVSLSPRGDWRMPDEVHFSVNGATKVETSNRKR